MTGEPICYAIVLKSQGVILSADTVKKHYPNYGNYGGGLHGWRPPKKVYYTLKAARSAFSLLPVKLKLLCAIQPLGPCGDMIDMRQYVIDAAKQKLAEAQNELNEYDHRTNGTGSSRTYYVRAVAAATSTLNLLELGV